ncbi:glycoside hydrolase family 15 protein [Kribbella deserti]|uniref:Glycoside hydrolase family 15 protein n=1 Tax=Kribbella deserti TaxID=1926257 RepID=A0ABV6QI81_9ACTN
MRRAATVYPWAVIGVLLVTLTAGALVNVRMNPHPQLVEGLPPEYRKVSLATDLRLPSTHPELVRQALTDLKALTPNGYGPLAGWDGPWRYVWPRDASFTAAAWCAVGQYDEASEVFAFLDKVRPQKTKAGGAARELAAGAQPHSGGRHGGGRWEARYHGDASGPMLDGRHPQLDGSGWVLWSAWFCATLQGDRAAADAQVVRNWPMLRQSADQITMELGSNGLPSPSPDYWERNESELTLGTVAPLLAGLRSASALAKRTNHLQDAERWSNAAGRLEHAIDRAFGGRRGYPRTKHGGADAIVTVLGPPFAAARPPVVEAIERSHAVLTLPNGGVTPGQDWRADGVAWTPQTALFGLSAAARGDRRTAESVLAWLDNHRTSSGSIPEKVNRLNAVAGEAPLGWTSALVVLTATALDRPLPIP